MVAEIIREGQRKGEISAAIDAAAAAWLYMGIGQMLDLSMLTGMDPVLDPCKGENMGMEFHRFLFGDPA